MTRRNKNGQKPRQRKRCFGVAAFSLSVVVFWAIPEAIVRVVDPPLSGFRGCRFGGDPNSPILFRADANLGWSLRPRTTVEFTGATVRTNSLGFRGGELEGQRRTVVCLGDSATFGWRVQQYESFPAVLASLLEKSPQAVGRWQVLNAGVPGYCSRQSRLQFEQILGHVRPALTVVCLSSNETWAVRPGQRPEQPALQPWFVRILKSSRFLVWVAEHATPPPSNQFVTPADPGAVMRVSREEFAANVDALVSLAKSHGSSVWLVAPPVNLLSPFAGLDGQEWERHYSRVFQLAREHRFEEAFAFVQKMTERHHRSFHPVWLRGFLLSEIGDANQARDVLERSFEMAPFPDRCRASYRDVLRDVARRRAVTFVDANDWLRAGTSSLQVERPFLDHCHPTAAGHRIIAEAMFEILLDGKGSLAAVRAGGRTGGGLGAVPVTPEEPGTTP